MKEKGRGLDGFMIGLLCLLALIGCNQGADLTDTTYSLANYLFFHDLDGEWIYATFLANAMGTLLMTITGGRMLWMNVAGSVIIALTSVIAYCGMRKTIPRFLLFVGEVIAIGLCWCPRVIFYNYLTYLLLTAAAIILYHAVLSQKNILFLLAGILLGLNVLVRVSNLTETALILLVWYGAFLNDRESAAAESDADKNKKGHVWKQTGICIGGYLIGLLTGILLMIATVGTEGYSRMFHWIFSLFTAGEDAGGYSMGEMLGTILDNYMGNVRWLLFMAAGMTAGVIMFSVKREKFVKIKKLLYLAGIVLLGVYFYRNGVYDFKYYNNGSIFKLCVIFLLCEWLLCIIMLFHKQAGKEEKLLSALVMIILLITPLGSNNHLFTCINNMFLLAPAGCFFGYRLYGYLREKAGTFPCAAMGTALVMALLVQSILFRCVFVFHDGIDGMPRDATITSEGNYYLADIRTTQANARAIEELTDFANEGIQGSERLILYGNIPGVSYLLHMSPALSTIWPDLDSFPVELFCEELDLLENDCVTEKKNYPVIILSPEAAAFVTEDTEGMMLLNVDAEAFQTDEKLTALSKFMLVGGYLETFSNEKFVIFVRE